MAGLCDGGLVTPTELDNFAMAGFCDGGPLRWRVFAMAGFCDGGLESSRFPRSERKEPQNSKLHLISKYIDSEAFWLLNHNFGAIFSQEMAYFYCSSTELHVHSKVQFSPHFFTWKNSSGITFVSSWKLLS